MWMVDPRILCRQHLLGEHVEIHMFIGAFNREKSVEGYLQKGLLEVHNLASRHNELVEEMKRRGYQHHSEVEEKWNHSSEVGFIDRKRNLKELINRCSRCKRRYLELQTR